MFKHEPNIQLSNVVCNYLVMMIFTFSCAGICYFVYFYYPGCSTSDVLLLKQWIFGCAIAYSIIPLLHLTIFGLKHKIGAILYYSYLYFLSFPFNISWSIAGSIILFRDSSICKDLQPSIWFTALSTLIFQWLTILATVIEIIGKIRVVRTARVISN